MFYALLIHNPILMKKFLPALWIVCSAFFVHAQTATWSSDVARIVYKHCTPCHHPGGLAPTSFMSYSEAAMYKFNINYAVSNGIMPPWKANPNYKTYAHQRVLTPAEILAIQQWATNGAPAGNLANAPAPPVYSSSSQLGSVDLSLTFPSYTVVGNGDVYRNFVVNTGLTQTKYATALEVIPGNPEIVHHVLVFMDTTNNPINPNNPGGTGSLASKLIYGYVPGGQPYFTPPGTGFRLPPNTRIIFQMHYAPGSAGLSDATTFNMKLTTTPQREISFQPALNHFTSLTNGPLSISANTTKTFYEQATVPATVTLLAASPHMHLIGRSLTTFATTSTPGDTIRFVDIPQWDFHWQDNYIFPNTVKVPSGATLRARAFYDNTANNPFNPNSPPQNVSAGEGTEDEMMMVFFAYMPYQNGDENLIVDKRILPRSGTTFCTGQSVLLEAISGTGYTYQWYRDGNLISGANTSSYIATLGGNYTVAITLGPNTLTSDAVAVTVNALPTASVTSQSSTAICPGGNVQLNANTGSGLTYKWYKNDTLISGATSASYTAAAAGNYAVEVSNGCSTKSTPVTVTTTTPTASISASGSTTICANSNVTLTASAGTTYLWSNGATLQNITVNQAGNYTVTVSTPGCSATASQAVVVNPLPTPFFTYAVNSNTVTFTNSSSNSTTYSWDFGDGALDNTASPTHTYANTGTYTVTLTTTNSCGSTTYTQTVNLSCQAINVSINANGNTAVCTGETVTLNTNAVSGYSYQWLYNGQAINGATSTNIIAAATGNYALQITDQSSCPGTSNTITVTIHPLPVAPVVSASGSTSFCADEEVTLSTTAISGINYQWLNHWQPISNATGNTYTTTQTGSYALKATDQNGCINFSDSTLVTVFALPAAPVITANGNLLSSTTANTYEWQLDGSPVGATGQQFTASISGCYSVEITDANGCRATSDTVCIEILGIENTLQEQVKIYPNPSQAQLILETEFAMLNYSYRISDVLSKIIVAANVTGNRQQIDLSNFSSGAYLLHLYDNGGKSVALKRFLVTKE